MGGDVLVVDSGAVADRKLDHRDVTALSATGALDIDAICDAEVLIGVESDSQLAEVERKERHVRVAQNLRLKYLASKVRVLVLP